MLHCNGQWANSVEQERIQLRSLVRAEELDYLGWIPSASENGADYAARIRLRVVTLVGMLRGSD